MCIGVPLLWDRARSRRTCTPRPGLKFSEVQPKRQLDLPGRSQSHCLFHCRVENAERSPRAGRGERLPRLQLIVSGAECLVELRRQARKVRAVEQVINLPAEFAKYMRSRMGNCFAASSNSEPDDPDVKSLFTGYLGL